MTRKTKRILLVLSVLCLTFLAGFAVKTVQLLNENPPLIDLNTAIVEAKFGKNGNEAHADGEEPDKNSEKPGKTIKIRVCGEAVWMEEHRYFSLDNLNTRIISNYKEGDEILLIDDYAEAHFYREVLAILEKLNAERGFAYAAD
ncbi:MAG: hypothetical protein J5721_01240 [Lachnospiraceae bacterium]|nr:hypothetical protein [Lachnospiraceae bacterium]